MGLICASGCSRSKSPRRKARTRLLSTVVIGHELGFRPGGRRPLRRGQLTAEKIVRSWTPRSNQTSTVPIVAADGSSKLPSSINAVRVPRTRMRAAPGCFCTSLPCQMTATGCFGVFGVAPGGSRTSCSTACCSMGWPLLRQIDHLRPIGQAGVVACVDPHGHRARFHRPPARRRRPAAELAMRNQNRPSWLPCSSPRTGDLIVRVGRGDRHAAHRVQILHVDTTATWAWRRRAG